jgi:hypothetical protein
MSESTNQPTAQPIDLSAGLVSADSQPNTPTASQPTPSTQPIDLSAGLVSDSQRPPVEHDPNARFSVPEVGTISAIKPPAHIGEALEQWANNVSNDLKYGTDVTGVGTVLKKMGAHGVYAGNSEAVGDFMASLPLGAIKALRGVGKLGQGKVIAGGKDIASGVGQAGTIPAAFVAPEESVLSKEGLLSDAAAALSKTGGKVIDAAKSVETWAKANPLKALAIEGIARELGVDPIQLTHKAVKYGKGLFGTP